MKDIIIAIDGHSSTGKSSFAKTIAAYMGYVYVDTGAMYRSVTLYALRHNLFVNGQLNAAALVAQLPTINVGFGFNSATGTSDTYLNGENVENEIRNIEVSQNVSVVSAVAEVREKMVSLQQQMGTQKGLVMDGRDIGTTVFPQAELKLFMTAEPVIRAKRRYDELIAKGEQVTLEEILKNVEERDYIDSHREVSPLRQATDALVLDNSYMTPAEQMEWFKQLPVIKTALCK